MMFIFGSTRSPTIYTKLSTKGSQRGDGFTVMVKILAFLRLMVISKLHILREENIFTVIFSYEWRLNLSIFAPNV